MVINTDGSNAPHPQHYDLCMEVLCCLSTHPTPMKVILQDLPALGSQMELRKAFSTLLSVHDIVIESKNHDGRCAWINPSSWARAKSLCSVYWKLAYDER